MDTWAVNASDKNDGTADAPMKTISRAAQLALPADTVLVSKGVYREHVSPAHGGYDVAHMINYVAKQRHQVVIKGSELWHPKWQETTLKGVSGTVWQATVQPELFTYDFPTETFNLFTQQDGVYRGRNRDQIYVPIRPSDSDGFPPMIRGMIFMDGGKLAQARSLTDFASGADIFYVAGNGKTLYARFRDDRPQEHKYEITVREQAFAPRSTGIGFIRVRGFAMEHGATAAGTIQFGFVSPGSVNNPNGGWHWIIENNIIRWSNACGLDIGMGHWGPGRSETRSSVNEEIGQSPTWRHWIRSNTISDHGQAGIWSIGAAENTIVEYNRIERNGWKNNLHHGEAAGLKMHGSSGVVIRGNLVRDNDCWGLWLDIVGGNNRITQNLVISNMLAGIFVEGVWGHTLVDNNISAFTRTHAFYQMNLGDGFYNHQASHVTFAHNLAFANTGYGFRCLMWGKQQSNRFPDRNGRVSHNRVVNNIACANGRGAICLPLDQEHCKDNVSDHNFIWGASGLPLFELGRGIMAPSKMMATVEAAMTKAGAGPDQVPLLTDWKRGALGPNVGDMRHFGPLVSLRVWQAAQQRDLHSMVGPLPTLYLTRAGQMHINLNIPDQPVGKARGEGPEVHGAQPQHYRSLDQVQCEQITEIFFDYLGNPRPNNVPPTVGPFQDLEQLGQDEDKTLFIHLWPPDPSRQPPAESLRLDRPQPQLDEQERIAGESY